MFEEELVCYDSEKRKLTHFTQWDSNQTIFVNNSELALSAAPIFHFCNNHSKETIPVLSELTDDNYIKVAVPNELLQVDDPILVYLYKYYDDGSAKTLYANKLGVRKKLRQPNYIYINNVLQIEPPIKELLDKHAERILNESQAILERITIEKKEELDTTGTEIAHRVAQETVDNAKEDINTLVGSANAASATVLESSRLLDGIPFDGSKDVKRYVLCTTPADDPIKTIYLDGLSDNINGLKLTVSFVYGISCEHASIKIYDQSTKREIMYKGKPLPKNYIKEGAIVELVCVGLVWRVIGELSSESSGINAKMLWRGALLGGGTITFNVPENCFHNNGTTLTLLVDGYYGNGTMLNEQALELTGAVLCFGAPGDFGLGSSFNNATYAPYYDKDGNAVSHIYKTKGYDAQAVTLSVLCKAKKVPDTRYAVCTVSSPSSTNYVVITCISAIVPQELEG